MPADSPAPDDAAPEDEAEIVDADGDGVPDDEAAADDETAGDDETADDGTADDGADDGGDDGEDIEDPTSPASTKKLLPMISPGASPAPGASPPLPVITPAPAPTPAGCENVAVRNTILPPAPGTLPGQLILNGTVEVSNTNPYAVTIQRVGVRLCSNTAAVGHLRVEAACPTAEAPPNGVLSCPFSIELPVPGPATPGATLSAWPGLVR